MFRQRLAFFALLVAATMDHLDGSIVNIVFPVMQRELGATLSTAQWISGGYTLTFGLFLVTAGRLGDLYGRKRMLLLGIGGFTVASALCGLAPDAGVLVAARLAQGLSSAAMTPQIIALVPILFGEQALGVYAGVTGVAAVGGQFLGALLTEADPFGLGWRTIFLLNMPGGLLALVIAASAVPDARADRPVRADLFGIGLLTIGLVLLITPLTLVHQTGWRTETALSVLGSAAVLLGFVRWQRRRPNTAVAPARLFGVRGFTSGLLITTAVFGTVHSYFFAQSLFLQRGLASGVFETALVILPWLAGISVGTAGTSSLLVPTFGQRVLDVALVTMTCGFGLVSVGIALSWAPSQWSAGLLVAGLGMGGVTATVLPTALREVPPEDLGVASGLISSAQQLGGVLGTAVLGALFFAVGGFSGPVPAFQAVVWSGSVLLLGALAYRHVNRA